MKAIEIEDIKSSKKVFSICTLVTDLKEYEEMRLSFEKAGFSKDNSEFIYIDNSQHNKYDAYEGVRKFLSLANAEYTIICHQDILLQFDTYDILMNRIEELTKRDNKWAILGNAGYSAFNDFRLRISDPFGDNRYNGPLPVKVHSLDENFLIVKKSAQLSVSNNIEGFHFYATDLCIIADILGFNAYVIDFHLYHKSGGSCNENFFEAKRRFLDKYTHAFRARYMESPCTKFFISGSTLLNKLMMRRLMYSLRKKIK